MKNMKSANRAFTLVEIMIVVLIIGILLAIAIPNFIRAREQSRAKSCSANIKQLDSAAQQWAMDTKAAAGATVTSANLVGPALYVKKEPLCPSGTTAYTLSTIDAPPVCPNATAGVVTAQAVSYFHTINGEAL
ncbi:MAG: prepilin-type N-terminal cleavage/methylation domain-containing protein [Armatimonadetes bacterium]|nr:prepilin-type N-terminal cleavage/methylation domain-containing protein [Armatimonadota bacterium]